VKYTVVWLPDVEAELLRIWLDSSLRGEVTAAAREIDRILAADPNEEGESRDAGNRILLVRPLCATYRVSELDLLVTVLGVWRSND
jgi:hypothetical protein